MAERILLPLADQAPPPPTEADMAAALEQTEVFLRDSAPHLGRLFGIDLKLQVAQLDEGAGMATDMESGDVLVDPRFFFEAGYTTADEASYGIIHETAAHVRKVLKHPDETARLKTFQTREKGSEKARHLFVNILEDIEGNNLSHAVLPRMAKVAEQLYGERLFKETDYTELPRHAQFLYKIIRQEMVPDSDTTVLPEVDAAIEGLRDYRGAGDVIKYSTAVTKSAHEKVDSSERFGIWTTIIFPVYQELLEQDRQDPERQDKQGQPNQGEGQGESSDQNQSGEQGQQSGEQQGQPSSGDGQPTDNERFGSYYDDYSTNRHPEPISHDEMEKIEKYAKEKAQAERQANDPRAAQREHERRLNEKVQRETGHGLREQRRYNAEIEKWQTVIADMRDVFQSVISERIQQKRGLSRRSFVEGAVLNPDQLVQTVIDIHHNVSEPEAFRDYETMRGQTKAIGKTDYVFLLDVSGSMRGDKAEAAAASTVIGLEGLAAMQRDIETAEAENHVDLDLDIRTAIYVFGDGARCVKPLSTKLNQKERLDAYAAVANPGDGSTQDFLALEEIEGWSVDSDRRKIIIAVSDGGSNGAPNAAQRARGAVDKLRGKGWFVYGISIGSDDAENLYRPTVRRVDDPAKLPDTISKFIEATIS